MAVPRQKSSEKFSTTIVQGSEEDFELYCQPCYRDDARHQAVGYCTDCEEHLCDSCFNTHRRPRPSRHHKLLDKTNMPRTQQPSVSSHPAGPSLTKPCPKHRQEILKYYCHNHKALLCNVCVTIEHTVTSCKVNYIPKISGQTLNSNEYREILQDIDDITERFKEIVIDLRKVTETSNRSLTKVLTDVQNFRKEINLRLDELEREVTDKVNVEKLQNDTRVRTVETKCDNAIKALQASSDSIEQLNKAQQADELFIELESTKQLIEHNEEMIKKRLSSDVMEYHFEPNQSITRQLQKEKSFGILTEKTLRMSSSLTKWNPSLQGEIFVTTSKFNDNIKCWITGMVCLNSNQLVLADRYTSSIKMLDITQKSITAQLKLDSKPWDVTCVTSDQLAVTLPLKKSILFVSASPRKLNKVNTLKVDGECLGITHQQGKFAVSFQSPAKLEVIDLKGNILMSVTNDSAGETIFNNPQYVKANMDFIYVSDSHKNAILRFNWQGGLTGKYESIDSPLSLAMLGDGSLLVNEANKSSIQHLCGDLARGKVVLQNLFPSRAVSWCNENSTMYISSSLYSGYSMFDDGETEIFIQVYKML